MIILPLVLLRHGFFLSTLLKLTGQVLTGFHVISDGVRQQSAFFVASARGVPGGGFRKGNNIVDESKPVN